MKYRPADHEHALRHRKSKAAPSSPNTQSQAVIWPAMLICALGACGSDSPSTASTTPPPVSTPNVGAPVAGGASIAPSAPSTPTGVSTPTPTSTAKPPGTPAAGPDGSAGSAATVPVSAEILPCGISQTLAGKCQNCHGATPIAGAPMALVTYADLHKPAVTKPTMKVYQLAKLRIHDVQRPMPPTTNAVMMSAAEMATLDKWFDAGALPGTTADTTCAPTPPKETGGLVPGEQDGSFGPLVPRPGETCYEFKTHQSTTSVDDLPYDVGTGEHYEQFYFETPWPTGSVATSYATITDNAKVLHHWLLFSSDENEVEGFHKTAPYPTLIGTNPMLLAGWAVGGPNLVPPDDVGLELPAKGKQLNVQWHFYNSTDQPQVDKSRIQICTVPAGMRAHTGNITWTGTEDLNGNVWFGGAGMPAHQKSTFTTTCVPGRAGLKDDEPIHIIGFEPHMHRIGTHMKTDVTHKDGKIETLFDKPFSFGNETHYFMKYDLLPGETLTTSCSFDNTNDFGVPFGESSDSEMCYQFTYAWPAHALSNFAPSILGVTDTCW